MPGQTAANGQADYSCLNAPVLKESLEHLVIIFPGAGGLDGNIDRLQEQISLGFSANESSFICNWQEYSGNVLTASKNGLLVGDHFADKIGRMNLRWLRKVSVVGISVGAFAADALVSKLRRIEDGNLEVNLLLLDPFYWLSIFDMQYGIKNMGRMANSCVQIMNTDDKVPFTDKAFDHCKVFNITSLRPDGINGHDWPLIYFTRKLAKGEHWSIFRFGT